MNKRLLIPLALSVAFLLILIMPVFAPGPAIVIKDDWCNLLDADGNFFQCQCAHRVLSGSGNSKITCQATQPDYATKPKKAVHFDYDSTGIYCSTGWGLTTDWKIVVTPSGQVTLVCHINVNK